MMTLQRKFFFLLPAVLLAACSSTRSTTGVADDVYFNPSKAPVVAAAPRSTAAEPVPAPAQVQAQDDYYDANTSETLNSRGYYDMTYNDPYYYNYGRFGFNTAPMGWQTGWNSPGWGGGMGMGMGWGNNMGWGNGWNLSMGYGYGYGSGVYSGWSRPLWGYDPWGWNSPRGWNNWGNSWGGYGGGYGYGGGFYGPWGSCYSCYTPISYGDGWSNTVVAPRSGVGSNGGTAGIGGGVRRRPVRNPAGLSPVPNDRSVVTGNRATEVDRTRTMPATTPRTDPGRDRNVAPQRDRGTRDVRPDRSIERSTPSRSPGFGDGGGGGRTSPSRDTGGGGGGNRTSPGRR